VEDASKAPKPPVMNNAWGSQNLGILDHLLPEPLGGAHSDTCSSNDPQTGIGAVRGIIG